MNKWQPIETAPKNGESIFLYEEYADVPFVGRWEHSGWVSDKRHLDIYDDSIVYELFEQSAITHWMPIMALPVAKK